MPVNSAFVWDGSCVLHEISYLHPESPQRLLVIKDVVFGDGVGRVLEKIDARKAREDEIAYIHDENYIRQIQATADRERTFLDPDTSTNAYTWLASQLAAGGFIKCVEAVWDGRFKNAYAFVRPPGHHAERGRAMGFCIFNNIAIGAWWLKKNRSVERIAIVDFDVHHCNGTQHAFYDRPDIFVASVHHYPFYPGTGAADEKGAGEGTGATLNIPLGAGAGDDDYRRAFEDGILPAVQKFRPQIILVSAGYDAHKSDPLGGMRVTTEGFRWMMDALAGLAKECCNGKLAVTLEGGYNLNALRDSVEAQLEVMVEN